MSWSLALMLDEHQLAQMVALAYPWVPSPSQLFAVYVAEVLGHTPAV